MCQFGRCHCRHTGRIFQHTIRDPLFRIEKCIPEQSSVTTLPGVSPIIILLSFQARCLRFVRN